MTMRIKPTTVKLIKSVTTPFVSTFEIPAKVKSPGFMLASISAVYGARAISNAIIKIGLAYAMRIAKSALLITKCHGFSASVIGPPNALNSCQTVIRNRMHQAAYCIISKALVTKGKYCSIANISVPSAFKNIPDTASIIDVMMLAIQFTIPSKIQSRIRITPYIKNSGFPAVIFVIKVNRGLNISSTTDACLDNTYQKYTAAFQTIMKPAY